MQSILCKIQLKSLDMKFYNGSIAIITIYRNKSDNTRLEQKRLFVYWMNKMLSQICNYDLIVVEQSKDYQFNIGKLKNIGFDYLNKNKSNKIYTNYIFADIDTIPDSNLIGYFFKQTDSLNTLAKYGTRYESIDNANVNKHVNTHVNKHVKPRPFVGALISCSQNVFKELNGYPNNFYGWEGEDTNLLLRLYGLNKPLYVNSSGKVIDIEELGGFKKDITVKISELNTNSDREKNINWENYKSNGLTNLNYTVLYENKSKYLNSTNYHIIVDLEYESDKKKFPHDYNFTQTFEKKYYKNFINDKLNKIEQIEFEP
jgi:hypothetical protein